MQELEDSSGVQPSPSLCDPLLWPCPCRWACPLPHLAPSRAPGGTRIWEGPGRFPPGMSGPAGAGKEGGGWGRSGW